jgi:hypothetical protein
LTQLASEAATMTPEDVPGPRIDIETLFPWLAAIAPAAEPVRPKPKPEPLAEAA